MFLIPGVYSLLKILMMFHLALSWGWQSKLSERPDGTLVLQMTNFAPWGEEGRAARMVFTRTKT